MRHPVIYVNRRQTREILLLFRIFIFSLVGNYSHTGSIVNKMGISIRSHLATNKEMANYATYIYASYVGGELFNFSFF